MDAARNEVATKCEEGAGFSGLSGMKFFYEPESDRVLVLTPKKSTGLSFMSMGHFPMPGFRVFVHPNGVGLNYPHSLLSKSL
jgi:hypothetical protein